MSNTPIPVLGYDIGGTKIAVCVADSDGALLSHERIPSAGMGDYANVKPEMIAAGKRVVAAAGLQLSDMRGCGVCAPGPLDIANGLLLKSPNMVWDRAPVREDLAQGLGIPTFLDNDANAGALAVWFYGAGKGLTDIVYLTMSTGVGGGVISGGQLMQGTTGVGGELGHIILDVGGPLCGCGQRGCLEAFCGGRNVELQLQAELKDCPEHAMMKLPGVQGDLNQLNYQALRDGVQQGIPLAMEMWDRVCFRLAQGIGICLIVFNPQIVVLGTLAYYSGDMLMEPVLRHLPRFAWSDMRTPCRVEPAALGKRIGELAGASVALYGLQKEGLWHLPS